MHDVQRSPPFSSMPSRTSCLSLARSLRPAQVLCGTSRFSFLCEGPPKGAHGASIMLVFDEILAYPVWRSGVTAFTANVSTNLRKMVHFPFPFSC